MSELVRELFDLREFLNGAAPLNGLWYGDRHPTKVGAFWWRSEHLGVIDKAIAALTAANQLAEERLGEIERDKVAYEQLLAHNQENARAFEAAEQSLAIAELKNKGTLANNLCPDHRDKQVGQPCLACTIETQERALVGAQEDARRYRWIRADVDGREDAASELVKAHGTEKLDQAIDASMDSSSPAVSANK